MNEKIPEGWKRVKLGEVLIFENGKVRPKIEGNIPIYGGNGILGYCNNFNYNGETIIIGRVGAYCGTVFFENRPIWISDNAISGKAKEANSTKYLYYLLKNLDLNKFALGSSHPLITQDLLNSIEVNITTNENEQKAITSVLSSLDDKIDLLHRQNQTLEKMAETLFRKWFIEDAKDDWEEVKLGDFFPIITGKKNANFATDDGKYPFFTCSQKISKAPSYSFEGHAILLAGNGDFNVKRYNGKFEAYQRTYVLTPYNEDYVGLLYTLIKYFLLDITGSHQGSVINFITKEMIENFSFKLPKNREKDESFKEKLANLNLIYEKIDFNLIQIQTLENFRDTLLPKLMSGEVRVNL